MITAPQPSIYQDIPPYMTQQVLVDAGDWILSLSLNIQNVLFHGLLLGIVEMLLA